MGAPHHAVGIARLQLNLRQRLKRGAGSDFYSARLSPPSLRAFTPASQRDSSSWGMGRAM
jgi:hypothetical protein